MWHCLIRHCHCGYAARGNSGAFVFPYTVSVAERPAARVTARRPPPTRRSPRGERPLGGGPFHVTGRTVAQGDSGEGERDARSDAASSHRRGAVPGLHDRSLNAVGHTMGWWARWHRGSSWLPNRRLWCCPSTAYGGTVRRTEASPDPPRRLPGRRAVVLPCPVVRHGDTGAVVPARSPTGSPGGSVGEMAPGVGRGRMLRYSGCPPWTGAGLLDSYAKLRREPRARYSATVRSASFDIDATTRATRRASRPPRRSSRLIVAGQRVVAASRRSHDPTTALPRPGAGMKRTGTTYTGTRRGAPNAPAPAALA
ncbi:hypothetical protein FHS42_006737 [Streptomyces zagrosensis]|uniref:Uncharacterized protein n=1 Tax=Streptomyces zagrosensis TaxID=1042984 RepID=A0A7W9QG38_9ACTN|nr:hypothetical protein [Streptomyces zagrosensis]